MHSIFTKNRLKTFFLVFFACLTGIAYGQVTISGKVVAKAENKPIEGATVAVKNTSTATTTD